MLYSFVATELERLGFKTPLLIGGATTSQVPFLKLLIEIATLHTIFYILK